MKTKNQYLIYAVTSDAHSGRKREFPTKAAAVAYARCVWKDGWWSTVTDMRTGNAILDLRAR
jgi:hypothetical protein